MTDEGDGVVELEFPWEMCFGEETTVPEHKDICVGQIDYIGKPLQANLAAGPKTQG